MLGKETLVVLAYLSQLVAEKIVEPISHMSCWVNGPIVTMVVIYYSRMFCVAHLPIPLWYREP